MVRTFFWRGLSAECSALQHPTIIVQNVPSDAAIALTLNRVITHPPEPAPIVTLDESPEKPPTLLRRLWLDSLPTELANALPVNDLLGWLSQHYPAKTTAEILSGFSRVFFDDQFLATFSEENEA